jgi:NAD(P)-dependent dehydrogenase (short-subunit alcohol dehydrogenase family)
MRDSRGYEAQFSTNHLGHFQLTARLSPALVKANGARVVSLSSQAHHRSPVLDDWNFQSREYDPGISYSQSKTANILFVVALDARGAKVGVHAFAVHPGCIVETDLIRWSPKEVMIKRGMEFGMVDSSWKAIIDPKKQLKTPQQGASTSVWAATSPALNGKGGIYLENNNIAPLCSQVINPEPVLGTDSRGFSGVKDYAIDRESADKLWALSQQLIGVWFPI